MYSSVITYIHIIVQQFSRISSCKTGTLYPWRDNSHLSLLLLFFRLPWFLSGKESACNAGDVSLIPRSGRSPREGNGEALQYSCLESPMDRGAWQATVHVVPRVGHNLPTKPPPPLLFLNWNWKDGAFWFCTMSALPGMSGSQNFQVFLG